MRLKKGGGGGGRKSSPLSQVWRDKYKETSRGSQRKIHWRCQCGSHQCGKIAYFQNRATSSIFHPPTHSSHPVLSSHLHTPAVYGRTLHIHGPLVFENLSPGLFHPFSTEPSDWLTNKPDTNPPRGGRAGVGWSGGWGHLLSLPQHPHVWEENTRRTARLHMLTAMNTPPAPTCFASTHRSLSFAWVKSSQTPGLVLDLPTTSAARENERARKCGG